MNKRKIKELFFGKKKEKKEKKRVCQLWDHAVIKGDEWSLREANDVGPVSLSNLRTNETPRTRGGVAYVKELSYKMATCLQSYRKYNNTLVHFLTINSAVIKYYI